jgi:hypothetical protein
MFIRGLQYSEYHDIWDKKAEYILKITMKFPEMSQEMRLDAFFCPFQVKYLQQNAQKGQIMSNLPKTTIL